MHAHTPSEKLAEFKQDKSGLNAAMPDVMKHLDGLFQVSQADGALSTKEKVFIGLGIGLATHCEACILVHLEKAFAAGRRGPKFWRHAASPLPWAAVRR